VESRSSGFATTWFTAEERALIGDRSDLQTVVWAAKEAVLKVLGLGMALSPRDVVITELGAHHLAVRLNGAAEARHHALGGGRIELAWDSVDAHEILVQATIAA